MAAVQEATQGVHLDTSITSSQYGNLYILADKLSGENKVYVLPEDFNSKPGVAHAASGTDTFFEERGAVLVYSSPFGWSGKWKYEGPWYTDFKSVMQVVLYKHSEEQRIAEENTREKLHNYKSFADIEAKADAQLLVDHLLKTEEV